MPDDFSSALPLSLSRAASDETPTAEAAFVSLCDAAFPRVYAYVRSQVSSQDAAEEIVGRVFLKACRARARVPLGEAGIYWLFRAAHSSVVDYWRVDGRRAQATVELDEITVASAGGLQPEDASLTRERAAQVLRAVRELSDVDRRIIALKFSGELTNREIARLLKLSSGAVGMRLLRSMRALRERLRDVLKGGPRV